MTNSELINHRQAHQLTQADVAALLGVTQSAVNRWEAGEREIPGPAEKLLDLYFAERWPFPGKAIPNRNSMTGQLEFTLEEWEELTLQAVRSGFRSTRELILHRIRQGLRHENSDAAINLINQALQPHNPNKKPRRS